MICSGGTCAPGARNHGLAEVSFRACGCHSIPKAPFPKGSCNCMVYIWALKGFLYSHFGVYVSKVPDYSVFRISRLSTNYGFGYVPCNWVLRPLGKGSSVSLISYKDCSRDKTFVLVQKHMSTFLVALLSITLMMAHVQINTVRVQSTQIQIIHDFYIRNLSYRP